LQRTAEKSGATKPVDLGSTQLQSRGTHGSWRWKTSAQGFTWGKIFNFMYSLRFVQINICFV